MLTTHSPPCPRAASSPAVSLPGVSPRRRRRPRPPRVASAFTWLAVVALSTAGVSTAGASTAGASTAGVPSSARVPGGPSVDKAFLSEDPTIHLFDPDRQPQLAAEVDETLLIRELYASAEDVSREAGYSISIELADFLTLYPSSFDRYRSHHLVTPPDDQVLQIRTHGSSFEDGADPGQTWWEIEADWSDRWAAVGRSLAEKSQRLESFRSRIESAAELWSRPRSADTETDWQRVGTHRAGWASGDLSRIRGLTSYRVDLEFEGRSKSYRAAVVWQRAENGEAELIVQDRHLLGVEALAALDWQPEQVVGPMAADALRKRLGSTPGSTPGSTLGPRAKLGDETGPKSCIPQDGDTKDQNIPWLRYGTSGHELAQDDGRHYGILAYEYEGRCTADCYASCIPTSTTECLDVGIVGIPPFTSTWHQAKSAGHDVGEGSKPDKAKCGFAFQCVAEECQGNICPGTTVSAGVSITAAGSLKFDFSQAEGSFWKRSAKIQAQYHCVECSKPGGEKSSSPVDRRLAMPPVVSPVRAVPSTSALRSPAPAKAFLGGDPELALFDPRQDPELASTLDELDVVERLYGLMESHLRISDPSARIELEAPRTHYPGSFDRLAIDGLISLPGRRTLRVVPRRMRVDRWDGSEQRLVWIEAGWIDRPAGMPSASKTTRERGRSLALALEQAFEIWAENPSATPRTGWSAGRLSALRAVTTYGVRLRFEGEEIRYRASVFWEPSEDGGVSFSIQDRNLSGLEQLAAWDGPDTLSIRADELEYHLDAIQVLPWESASDRDRVKSTARCLVKTNETRSFPPRKKESYAQHATGKHAYTLDYELRGSCTENCLASCSAVGTFACTEDGEIHQVSSLRRRWHEKHESSDTQHVSGREDKASCAWAYQCAVKECVDSVCPGGSASASISVLGTGFSYSFGMKSGALWKDQFGFSDTYRCVRCKSAGSEGEKASGAPLRLSTPPVLQPERADD